jgi:hypothetical protein
MRQPLPEELPSAFVTHAALAAGVTRSRLRGADLERPFHGTYLVRHSAARDEREVFLRRASAALARLGPGAFLSHRSAAILWQVPLPFPVDPEGPVDVGFVHPARPTRLDGVRAHRVQPAHVRLTTHALTGLRTASPASTFAMLGAVLAQPYDLVAVGDSLVSDRVFARDGALARVDQLEAAVFSGRRVGINVLRAALPRIRMRVASRPETWTRLTLVDAGLPEPAINLDVFDSRGLFIGCVDLAYPRSKVAIEYEGEHHLRDAEQWTKDILRYERLTADGWTVIRVTKEELFTRPHNLVARVRVALAARG